MAVVVGTPYAVSSTTYHEENEEEIDDNKLILDLDNVGNTDNKGNDHPLGTNRLVCSKTDAIRTSSIWRPYRDEGGNTLIYTVS